MSNHRTLLEKISSHTLKVIHRAAVFVLVQHRTQHAHGVRRIGWSLLLLTVEQVRETVCIKQSLRGCERARLRPYRLASGGIRYDTEYKRLCSTKLDQQFSLPMHIAVASVGAQPSRTKMSEPSSRTNRAAVSSSRKAKCLLRLQ